MSDKWISWLPKTETEDVYPSYSVGISPNRPSRYTQEEQLQIIDTHPLFTGVCPECGHEIDKPGVNWECPACGECG